MSNGTLGSKDLSFNVIVQNIRRSNMMAAIITDDSTINREEGKRILNNVERQVKQQQLREKEEELDN